MYSISLESGGIYRCEVSNEFPDFDTVTRAEILSVVGQYQCVVCLLSAHKTQPILTILLQLYPGVPVSAQPLVTLLRETMLTSLVLSLDHSQPQH